MTKILRRKDNAVTQTKQRLAILAASIMLLTSLLVWRESSLAMSSSSLRLLEVSPPLQSADVSINIAGGDSALKGSSATWPGIPVETLGAPLVQIGSNFVSQRDTIRRLFDTHIEEFLDIYSQRPDKINMCGIRVNHAIALFLAVKHLQPTTVIESGVNAGLSTYIIRKASPTTKILAFDPLDKPICDQKERWMDPSGKAVYYTGSEFKDIQDMDWETMIKSKKIDPSTTLVFLDDHQRVFDRFSTFMKYGFQHVVLEDNYKARKGATDGDRAGFTPKQMFSRVDSNSEFAFHSAMISYAEFPPLVSSAMSSNFPGQQKKAGGFMYHTDTNHDVVEPFLRVDEPNNNFLDEKMYQRILKKLELDPTVRENTTYMQLMNYNHICYFQLRPLAPHLVTNWK